MKTKYIIALVGLAAMLTLLPSLYRRWAPQFVRRFFEEAGSPFPLAFFRITFFLGCLFLFQTSAVRFSQLSPDLIFPPPGWNWLLSVVPIREPETQFLVHLHSILLVLSAIGLWTRWSILGSLLTAIWVYGIPEFYGKIDHYHHLVWFMAVFSVSPCADVLSVDAFWKAIHQADRGVLAPPSPSILYILPLRMFALLMGVIYFWAGFWKAWTGRIAWAFSDNMRFMLYNKWWELNWIPAFRIDHYPLLYKTAAATTIVWEVTFILFLFQPVLRHVAALSGLAFHNGTYAFMRIQFLSLQMCYVCLIDWDRIWRSIGLRLFQTPLQLIYDGNCKLCRRTIALLRTVDIFHRVEYINALRDQDLHSAGLSWIPADDLMRDIHAVESTRRVSKGYDAYVRLSLRIPWLWPIVPFLYLAPVKSIGMLIYRRVADSRTCSIVQPPLQETGAYEATSRSWIPIAAVGYGLFVAVALSSLAKFHSWPIAGYPTFEDLDSPQIQALVIRASSSSGEQKVQIQTLYEKTGIEPQRLIGLTWRILSVPDSPEKKRRLCALWSEVAPAASVPRTAPLAFYREVYSTYPEHWGNPPLESELVWSTPGCPDTPR